MLEKSATLVRSARSPTWAPKSTRFLRIHGAGTAAVRVAGAGRHRLAGGAGHPAPRRACARTQTSVTPCFAAVAESGGIVTLSGPDTPSTLNFVPDNHIVIVHASQVVRHFEDVWARVARQGLAMPRTLNIISGPSRTADIEQTIQLGAHGPRRLHILLVAA